MNTRLFITGAAQYGSPYSLEYTDFAVNGIRGKPCREIHNLYDHYHAPQAESGNKKRLFGQREIILSVHFTGVLR
ncbi:hypothetical protein Dda3937_04532 [Dickeya dadantii 3937]|uniref:Uncharacterized protein n=1 Tax=Dickeya dadantii (strain 3937) TaxID=198628 RepID=E0SJD5_DICD3|nr:hypothetical protein Dda3937_04532 [Dickeya dadantii 3937]